MKINSSHLVGAAIALAAVFFSKLDAQDARPATQPMQWSYKVELDTRHNKEVQRVIADASNAGWELLSCLENSHGDYDLIFRRPAQ